MIEISVKGGADEIFHLDFNPGGSWLYGLSSVSDHAFREVKQLEKEYNAAVSDFMRAVRTTGEIGMATIPDAQDAVREIKKIRADLTDLMKKLKEEAAIKRSKRLMAKIAEFYKKNDLY